jgi:hypothetical protein
MRDLNTTGSSPATPIRHRFRYRAISRKDGTFYFNLTTDVDRYAFL